MLKVPFFCLESLVFIYHEDLLIIPKFLLNNT